MSLESSRASRLGLKIESGSMVRALIGARLGSILPDEMVTGRLWSTLSQLAQFGLAPTSPPLLKRPDDKFSTTSFLD